MRTLIRLVVILAVAAGVLAAALFGLTKRYTISSPAMAPAIRRSDQVAVFRFSDWFYTPHRKDIVVFERYRNEFTGAKMDKAVPDNFRKVAGTDRQVALTFTIKEKPVIRTLAFSGQKKLSKGTLSDEIAVKKSDPYDRFKLDEDLKKILGLNWLRVFEEVWDPAAVIEASVAAKRDTRLWA